jgi:hypothetical protein
LKDKIERFLTLYSLSPSDRDILKSAGSKVSTHAKIGSLVGIGLGIYTAMRLRTMRLAYFKAFKAMEKPVELRFADGRTGTSLQHILPRLQALETDLCRTDPRCH